MGFSLDEIDRYERQVLVPEWGAAGQERVRATAFVVEGDGAAARVAACYLVGAGAGMLAVSSQTLAAALRARNPHATVTVDAPTGPAAVRVAGRRLVVDGDSVRAGAALALAALQHALALPCPDRVPLPDVLA